MLKFFFNRFSPMVRISEVVGAVLLAAIGYKVFFFTSTVVSKILFVLVLLTYAFIRFCAMWHWHRDAKRFSGIELQFKKALVPTAYIMCITGAAAIFVTPAPFLTIEFLLLAFMGHVNIILLWLFHKDGETFPAASLSRRANP